MLTFLGSVWYCSAMRDERNAGRNEQEANGLSAIRDRLHRKGSIMVDVNFIGKVQTARRSAQGSKLAIEANIRDAAILKQREAEALRTSLGAGEYEAECKASLIDRDDGSPSTEATFRGKSLEENPLYLSIVPETHAGESLGSCLPVHDLSAGCHEARFEARTEARREAIEWAKLAQTLKAARGEAASSASFAQDAGFRAANSVEAYHFGQ